MYFGLGESMPMTLGNHPWYGDSISLGVRFSALPPPQPWITGKPWGNRAEKACTSCLMTGRTVKRRPPWHSFPPRLPPATPHPSPVSAAPAVRRSLRPLPGLAGPRERLQHCGQRGAVAPPGQSPFPGPVHAGLLPRPPTGPKGACTSWGCGRKPHGARKN